MASSAAASASRAAGGDSDDDEADLTMTTLAGDPAAVAPPPATEAPALKPEQYKHFVAVYPCYINAAYSTRQGRRLPLDKLMGCSHPWPQDIAEAALRLGFGPYIMMEGKQHPRDFGLKGRVRIELKRADGTVVNPRIDTKEKLLVELARVIPMLDTRRQRLAHFERVRQQQLAQAAAAAPGAKAASKKAAAAAATTSGGGKKKGK